MNEANEQTVTGQTIKAVMVMATQLTAGTMRPSDNVEAFQDLVPQPETDGDRDLMLTVLDGYLDALNGARMALGLAPVAPVNVNR